MTNLNDVDLLWYMGYDKKGCLEDHVKRALEAWDKNKNTREVVPEKLVLPLDYKLEATNILGLEVIYSKYVHKGHFSIRGTLE